MLKMLQLQIALFGQTCSSILITMSKAFKELKRIVNVENKNSLNEIARYVQSTVEKVAILLVPLVLIL